MGFVFYLILNITFLLAPLTFAIEIEIAKSETYTPHQVTALFSHYRQELETERAKIDSLLQTVLSKNPKDFKQIEILTGRKKRLAQLLDTPFIETTASLVVLIEQSIHTWNKDSSEIKTEVIVDQQQGITTEYSVRDLVYYYLKVKEDLAANRLNQDRLLKLHQKNALVQGSSLTFDQFSSAINFLQKQNQSTFQNTIDLKDIPNTWTPDEINKRSLVTLTVAFPTEIMSQIDLLSTQSTDKKLFQFNLSSNALTLDAVHVPFIEQVINLNLIRINKVLLRDHDSDPYGSINKIHSQLTKEFVTPETTNTASQQFSFYTSLNTTLNGVKGVPLKIAAKKLDISIKVLKKVLYHLNSLLPYRGCKDIVCLGNNNFVFLGLNDNQTLYWLVYDENYFSVFNLQPPESDYIVYSNDNVWKNDHAIFVENVSFSKSFSDVVFNISKLKTSPIAINILSE